MKIHQLAFKHVSLSLSIYDHPLNRFTHIGYLDQWVNTAAHQQANAGCQLSGIGMARQQGVLFQRSVYPLRYSVRPGCVTFCCGLVRGESMAEQLKRSAEQLKRTAEQLNNPSECAVKNVSLRFLNFLSIHLAPYWILTH